ncbi:MAG: prolipoprotein diacylglyceryl transferase [Leptospirales bacterium]|nr:prolipoprotein diacylglyceryl transferase [Leptospirales bacterium]
MIRAIRVWIQKWLNREIDRSIILVQWNDVIIVRFGLVSAFALLLGLVSFIAVFRGIGISREAMRNLLIFSPLNLIFFSFVQGMIFSRGAARERFRNISFGFFGGIAGVFLTFLFASLYYGLNLYLMLDVSVLLAAFIHSYARTACINYGCCHGKERVSTEDSLHMIYKQSMAKAVRISFMANRPLYPVQFYESVGCFAIGLVLLAIALFWHKTGLMLGTYLMLYGSLRFFCEFYRGEAERRTIGSLTVYQWICLALILVGVGVAFTAIVQSVPGKISISKESLLEPLQYLPFLIFMPFVILFFYGFHYRTVGKWR